MNLVTTNCQWCGITIQRNSKDLQNESAHFCHNCHAAAINHAFSIGQVPASTGTAPSRHATSSSFSPMSTASRSSDDEFDLDTEEELEYCNGDEWDDLIWEPVPSSHSPSCECGAIKSGSSWHSDWCPIFTDPMGKDK